MIGILPFFRVVVIGVITLWLTAWVAAAPTDSIRLIDDGRTLVFPVEGIGEVSLAWSVTIRTSNGIQRLESGTVSPGAKPSVDGSAEDAMTVTLSSPETRTDLLFRFRFQGGSFIRASAGVRNTGVESIDLVEVSPIRGDLKPRNPNAWLVTGLHPRTPVIAPLSPSAADIHVHEHGMLYQDDGTGFVFGPVGDPVSDAGFTWRMADSGWLQFEAVTPMEGVRVDPGETRWGQEVAMVYGKPQVALSSWADAVAKSHGSPEKKQGLSGWNNWNYLDKKDISRELVDVTEIVKNSGASLRPAVVQMDYNYFDADLKHAFQSEWFPMCRKNIDGVGARFGVHVGVSGPSWPGLSGLPQLTETITRAVGEGISYFKVFYPPSSVKSDGRRTSFEIYRDHWRLIRKAAGEGAYLLFCDYEPNRAVVGIVDSSRVGPDADRERIRRAIPSMLRAYPLHDRWFTIDGDSYFTGTDIANISRVEGSWPLVRTWLSMTGLSCGTAITSDPWYWEDFKPYWRNVEILTPPARERTEVMDLGTAREWTRIVGHVQRDWGSSTVALLWNPSDTERTVTLDFAKAGMDPKMRHAVWSFWDDRYIGVAQGSWTSPRLGPAACQHLVFTPLPEKPGKPVLIGSNLHIYCGAAEVHLVESTRSSLSIQLTDAGARDGDLYLYSPMQPLLASAVGCNVSGITSAGENVWRVSLHERKPGAVQRIEMTILLPVSQQAWFWALVATAIASSVFAGWRYVVGLRLERARVLDQERARIARDIHDDLGASLTHIALLGELAQNEIEDPSRARTHVDDIFRAASKLTRSVDEIVWALNPLNDTVCRFAAYVGDFAQDFLQSAGIDCRLSIPADLPEQSLPPKTRHALFLIIKEVLHNVVSHSKAECVHLSITLDRSLLNISIRDNGLGFDPRSAGPSRPGGGHGLANMRQRVDEIGGVLDITSEAGKGATVSVAIKL